MCYIVKSDLVTFESSVELDPTEPVIVCLLGLVVSVCVEGGSGAEV